MRDSGEVVNLYVTDVAPSSLGVTSGWPWTAAQRLTELSSQSGWKLPEVEWPCGILSNTHVLYMGESK